MRNPRRLRRRRHLAASAAVLALGLLVSSCSSGGDSTATVTSNVTVAGSGSSAAVVPGSSSASGAGGTTSGSSRTSPGRSSSAGTSSTSGKGSAGSTGGKTSASASTTSGQPGAEPDGFVPTKLKAGEKPPQFIVVSFDGVGWHEKWQYWKSIEDKVPFHFTGFLSGTYMLSDQTKTKYQGPGHAAGKSSISWNTAADLPVEIADLNDALSRGDEIGTHFNGHFCSDNAPGGNDWDTDDWNNELDQFFSLVKNVDANNDITAKLNLPAGEIKGERTPCLEGHAESLFPALKAHGMVYDSSFTKNGISWPKKSADNGIWQIGMAEFPIHGTLSGNSPVDPGRRQNHPQITMDYNFWYSQENTKTASPDQSAADSKQVEQTYDDMFDAAFNGNRAPLILGNHFNAWNNNAYSDAIGNFVLDKCGQPNVKCVPFRDVVDWMNMQDPARLAQLQAEGAETAAP